nr:prolipoprotein diacylglyceryl transferase family protein [Anaplasma phagocytophilum]
MLLDLCACSIPLGLFLGRLTNLINGELYGRSLIFA